MTDQERWPRGTPGGGHAPGPGPGRFRPDDWADRVSARLPGGLRGLVPDNADPYGETKPDAVGDWAREAFEYEDEAGFRSKVSSFYVTRWPTSDTRSITVGGKFVTQPEDEYYTQGRHAGAWNFHVTINPEGQSVAEIDGIAVTYDYRGQGVASRWVDRFEREMRRQGVGQVRLFDLSAASSGRGTSFWESLGYEPWDGNMVKDLRT